MLVSGKPKAAQGPPIRGAASATIAGSWVATGEASGSYEGAESSSEPGERNGSGTARADYNGVTATTAAAIWEAAGSVRNERYILIT